MKVSDCTLIQLNGYYALQACFSEWIALLCAL